MNQKRIFITGASGCIGHYITTALIHHTNHELYLFVRNPEKLQIDPEIRPVQNRVTGSIFKVHINSCRLSTPRTVLVFTSRPDPWGREMRS